MEGNGLEGAAAVFYSAVCNIQPTFAALENSLGLSSATESFNSVLSGDISDGRTCAWPWGCTDLDWKRSRSHQLQLQRVTQGYPPDKGAELSRGGSKSGEGGNVKALERRIAGMHWVSRVRRSMWHRSVSSTMRPGLNCRRECGLHEEGVPEGPYGSTTCSAHHFRRCS